MDSGYEGISLKSRSIRDIHVEGGILEDQLTARNVGDPNAVIGNGEINVLEGYGTVTLIKGVGGTGNGDRQVIVSLTDKVHGTVGKTCSHNKGLLVESDLTCSLNYRIGICRRNEGVVRKGSRGHVEHVGTNVDGARLLNRHVDRSIRGQSNVLLKSTGKTIELGGKSYKLFANYSMPTVDIAAQ